MARRQPTTGPITCPFTILIDTAEQQPFDFSGLDRDGQPLLVNTKRVCLGRHPDSQGDYSIEGYESKVGIERKSMADAHNTILGWGDRRNRFIKELRSLDSLHFGAVIVECTIASLITNAPEWGKKKRQDNAKSLAGAVIAWGGLPPVIGNTKSNRFQNVHWFFCDDREAAQWWCFRLLQKYWQDRQEEKLIIKRAEKAQRLARLGMSP